MTTISAPQSHVETGTVLIVSNSGGGEPLAGWLTSRGYDVHATDAPQALPLLSRCRFDVCIVDDALAWERQQIERSFRGENLPTRVLALSDVAPASEAANPAASERAARAVESAVQHAWALAENSRLNRILRNELSAEVAGNSPAARSLRDEIMRVAPGAHPVLIRGESGTGHLAAARAVHVASGRSQQDCVTIPCSVLTAACLERELFGVGDDATGHDIGGRLEQAAGGTIVLEDIESISLPLQKKLLQIIERPKLMHDNAEAEAESSVRVIATSSADLPELVRMGQFREDLYQRLCGVSLWTTPLRRRVEDIATLCERGLRKLAAAEGRPIKRLSGDALALLETYHWPGNEQELENVLERAASLETGPLLSGEHVRAWLNGIARGDLRDAPGMTLAEMERKLIEATFARFGGNREHTAQALDIGLRTLSGKLREYGYPPRGGPGSNQQQSNLRAA